MGGNRRVLGVPVTARGEELTLAQWVELTRLCDPNPLKDLPQKAGEIFDVVDENDQVTGQATRGEVHAKQACCTARCMFSFSTNAAICCSNSGRCSRTRIPASGTPAFPGHLDAGEDYDAAAVRELDEEMGIRVGAEHPRKSPASRRARPPAGNMSGCTAPTTAARCAFRRPKWNAPRGLRPPRSRPGSPPARRILRRDSSPAGEQGSHES